MKAEYWVMRLWPCVVKTDNGHRLQPVKFDDMTPAAKVGCLALITAGQLAALPSGELGEPVEVFEHEADAAKHRDSLARAHPREFWRVVLNMEVP